MNINKLNKNTPLISFTEIARLHIAEIHFGFLPLLGEGFLSYLYLLLSQLDEAGLWVAQENGKIQGFIFGTADMKKSYKQVIQKSWISLIVKGFPSIFKRNVLSKLIAVLQYPFKNHVEKTDQTHRNTNAELLSIAVNSESQGKGIGKTLVLTLESALSEWGVSGDYYVTTNAADPDSIAFYQKMGFTPCSTQKLNDLVLRVYKKMVIPNSRKE